MANWGGLNPALNSWRNGINALLPGRDMTSDGGYADDAHGGGSQHQPDADGETDAFDEDVNVFKSSTPTGTPDEDRIMEALKKDFQKDARAHLWIHDRQIAQHDDRNWARDPYTGASPHTEHAHWESHEQNENDGSPWDMSHTIAVLDDMGMGPDDMKMDEFYASVGRAVRNDPKDPATAADRANRENLADAERFAFGRGYTAQGGKLHADMLDKISGQLTELTAAVTALSAKLSA